MKEQNESHLGVKKENTPCSSTSWTQPCPPLQAFVPVVGAAKRRTTPRSGQGSQKQNVGSGERAASLATLDTHSKARSLMGEAERSVAGVGGGGGAATVTCLG